MDGAAMLAAPVAVEQIAPRRARIPQARDKLHSVLLATGALWRLAAIVVIT
jgi:hypothetical protein